MLANILKGKVHVICGRQMFRCITQMFTNTNWELDGSRFYTEIESNSFNFETNNKMQVSMGRDIFHRVSKSDME